jgi:hypothetical protein
MLIKNANEESNREIMGRDVRNYRMMGREMRNYRMMLANIDHDQGPPLPAPASTMN